MPAWVGFERVRSISRRPEARAADLARESELGRGSQRRRREGFKLYPTNQATIRKSGTFALDYLSA